jgi:hypothetical protein
MGRLKVVDTRSPEQKGISAQLSSFLGTYLGQQQPVYEGERVAGMSDLEQLGLGQIAGASTSGVNQASIAALLKGLSGTPSTTINPETTQNYFQKAIADPTRKQFSEYTLPGIKESFAGPGGAGYWSGARGRAEMESRQDMEDKLSAQHANLTYQDELAQRGLAESAASRQQGAIGQSMLPYQQALTTMQAGGLPRQLEQMRLQSEMQKFMEARPDLSPVINQALSFLGQTQTTSYYEQSTLEKLLPLAAAFIGSAGGIAGAAAGGAML